MAILSKPGSGCSTASRAFGDSDGAEPLLVAVDDVHLADVASLALMRSLPLIIGCSHEWLTRIHEDDEAREIDDLRDR
jgi:hypothetical protein